MGEEEEQVLEHKQEERDAQKHGSTEDGVTESVAANGENWIGANAVIVKAVDEEKGQEREHNLEERHVPKLSDTDVVVIWKNVRRSAKISGRK